VALNGFDGLITDRLPSRLANRDVLIAEPLRNLGKYTLPMWWLIAYVKPQCSRRSNWHPGSNQLLLDCPVGAGNLIKLLFGWITN